MKKTALVHDFLLAHGGAEKVLEAIYALYPSPVFTLMQKGNWPFKKIISSYLNFPIFHSYHRELLPFHPKAIESFNLEDYSVILSSSYAFSKNIKKNKDQLHICYCHTPLRAIYDQYPVYLEQFSWWKKLIFQQVSHNVRNWDTASCNRVDHFIANSKFIADRIKKIYQITVDRVIYPPVDVMKFSHVKKKEDYFIYLGRLAPHKRVDLVVQAFSNLPQLKLKVVGDGVEKNRLKKIAGPNVEFLGYQKDEVAIDLLEKARGFVFMGVEDFGISLVEALAAGTPLVALGAGGANEILVDTSLGKKVAKQTVDCLEASIKEFLSQEYDPSALRQASLKFSKERFLKEYQTMVEEKCRNFFGY